MVKKFFSKLNLFWIIYFILLFLSTLGGIFIPKDNDIIWIWFALFYMPFLLYLVYPYGFFMGIWIQCKFTSKTKEILLLSIIYFILVLILLMVCGLGGILKNGILYHINFKFYPALGSALLFIVGAFIVKFIRKILKLNK